MDQLLTIPNLSIAELRKILQDNDVSEQGITCKEDLRGLVSDTLLTKMMIDELQENAESEYRETQRFSKMLEESKLSKEQLDREQLRLEQGKEYCEAVESDLVTDPPELSLEDAVESELVTDELSLEDLRNKRLQHFM
ncbi:hypothetical protein [uncultured Mediterranean phage]|nr:hypothetical protein [uncultured Mediterranean phage]